jgi:hypothetical protein
MPANTNPQSPRTVSRWWRVIAFGLAAGIAADVLAKRMTTIPDVSIPTRSLPAVQHDWHWFKPLPAREFKGATFAQIVGWLARESGMSIQFKFGTADGQLFTLSLPQGTVGEDLDQLLDLTYKQGGNDASHLCILENGSVLTIAVQSDAVEVRVYDIRPLLQDIEAEAPTYVAQSQSWSTQNQLQGQQQQQGLSDSRTVMIDEVRNLVMSNVDNPSWLDNGGDVGTTAEFGEFLIIRQTEANHRQIAALLASVRRK